MAQPESIESLKKLPLEELKARKEAAFLERSQLMAAHKKAIARIQGLRRQVKAMVDYAEEQAAKVSEITDPEKRQRVSDLNELRKQAALVNIETIDLMLASDLTKAMPAATVERIDQNCLKSQFIATEYNLLTYQRFMKVVAAEFQAGNAPATKEAAKPVAEAPAALPQRPSTGSLPATTLPPRRPGLPQAPTRPGGLAAPGARPAGPTGRPLPTVPGRTGPLAGQPGLAPRASGPLNNAVTGPLSAPSSADHGNGDEQLAAELRAAIRTPNLRQGLIVLAQRVGDLDATMSKLRGPEVGQLGVDLVTASPLIKQIAGKVYYLNRSLAELGPLGEKMPFDTGTPDPAVTQMLSQIAATPETPVEDPSKEPPKSDFSLSRALKSLFKT